MSVTAPAIWLRVDVVLDVRLDALEALRRHADGFGLRHRQIGLGERPAISGERNHRQNNERTGSAKLHLGLLGRTSRVRRRDPPAMVI